MGKIKYNPEITLGHVVQLGTMLITVIVFFMKMDSRLQRTESQISEVKLAAQEAARVTAKNAETIGDVAKTQAVLAALFDAHVRNGVK